MTGSKWQAIITNINGDKFFCPIEGSMGSHKEVADCVGKILNDPAAIWIQDRRGDLHNLDHVVTIEVAPES